MTDRRHPKKVAWKKTPPTKEGWYWYRDQDRETILHVFEPHAPGHFKAWDWDGGRLGLCSIAEYAGEWWTVEGSGVKGSYMGTMPHAP